MLEMTPSNKLLSDITTFRTYAKYLPHLRRRESLEESINRDMQMNLDKFPKLSGDIVKAYAIIHDLKVMPSMRRLQFAGEAIIKNNCRSYNCAFLHMDSERSFGETLFLLLSGCGVGYSVQERHISKLPKVRQPRQEGRFLVQDSIQGWAQALDALMEAYLLCRIRPFFDFSQISPKGTYLPTTGAKAPGPEPLRLMLQLVEQKLKVAIGRKLTDLEVHDIQCISSDCVLSGGIRRSALIVLFDRWSKAMLTCKHGNWTETAPWRARANNSAVLHRVETTYEEFMYVYKMCRESNAGEPAFWWTNDYDLGTNPCKPLNSLILTTNGYVTYGQALKSKDLLKVMRPDGTVSAASRPFKTGTKSVSRILLSNGSYLYGTNGHKHKNKKGQWVEIKDLKLGDRLEFSINKVNSLQISDESTYRDGVLAGYIWSDGWSYKRSDSPNSFRTGLSFGHHEFSAIPLLESITGRTAKDHGQSSKCKVIQLDSDPNGIYSKYGISKDKSDLLWIYGKSSDFKLGFIRAAFTADGSVRKNDNVELYSIHRNTLEILCTILQEFGIYSSVCIHGYAKSYIASDGKARNNKDCWKLSVYAGQFKKIGLLATEKQVLLDLQVEKRIYRYSDYVTVMGIEHNFSCEDVYDIEVSDNDHAYVDAGVTTHNCNEIGLHSNQFCNLTINNVNGLYTKKEFLRRVRASALLGTLQASYTDFPYLRPIWQETTESDALLGVSMTGIAASDEFLTPELLEEGAKLVLETNSYYARKIGINECSSGTCIKPEGSSSCVLGTSSGVHDYHDEFWIRRMRMNKDDALAYYLKKVMPELVEDDVQSSTTVVVSIPQMAPKGALLRSNSTALSLFQRAVKYNKYWVAPGYRKGPNGHNTSITINVRDNEWDTLGEVLWKGRKGYNGISLYPYDGAVYKQPPFESIDENRYNEMTKLVASVDLKEVIEDNDNTSRGDTVACPGGFCELP
jgi:hypothetical protein